MASYNEGIRAFVAGTDLMKGRRVKVSTDGTAVYAAEGEVGDGVTMYAVKAGESLAVRLFGCSGTVELAAGGAFGVAAEVYAAPDGKVRALPAVPGDYVKVGKAIESATADGDIVEVFPHPGLMGTIETVGA